MEGLRFDPSPTRVMIQMAAKEGRYRGLNGHAAADTYGLL
jgi:hypothetical protein